MINETRSKATMHMRAFQLLTGVNGCRLFKLQPQVPTQFNKNVMCYL
jgi:hypothetical protein